MTSTKNKLTVLTTVYPPISNADAVRLMRVPAVEKMLRTSDFYMIGARAQARLSAPQFDQNTNEMSFDFSIGDGPPFPVHVALQELPGVKALKGENFIVEFDKAGSGFKVWNQVGPQADQEPAEWFTTEKLLWDRTRGRPGIYGLDNCRDLATYDLLYVGIAKVGDSFDRLLARGHKARQEILSSEHARAPGARPSDEIFLFMFKAEPLIMTTFDLDHEFTDEDLAGAYDAKRIVADAEKAFVHLLDPPYNREKFINYPKGKDGLFGQGYRRYGYVIGEQMAFDTPNGRVRGGVDQFGMISNDADAIFVEGETVTLYTAEAMAAAATSES
jgi:hypothetical protein